MRVPIKLTALNGPSQPFNYNGYGYVEGDGKHFTNPYSIHFGTYKGGITNVWGIVVYVRDVPLVSGPLTLSKTLHEGDKFVIAAESLRINLDVPLEFDCML